MVPDLTLLVALVLGLYGAAQAESAGPVDALRAAGGTAGVVLVVVALCRMASDRAIRAVESQDAAQLRAAARATGLWPFAGWIAALQGFDWADFVGTSIPRVWFLLPMIATFLPLAIMVVAGWSAVRRVEVRFQPQAAEGGGALRRGLLRNGIVLVPLAVLTIITEAIYVLAALRVEPVRRFQRLHEAFPDVEVLLVLAFSLALGYFAPRLLRRLLPTRSLPAGPMRDAIERQLDALRVRSRDILLWESKGRVLNAMVVGLTGRSRYVVVSDGLLARLPLPEVLAVVSHEAGHARLRHLPSFLLVGISSILVFRSLEEVLGPVASTTTGLVLALAPLAFFWFGMLGWLSRRFERQADVFGALHAAALAPEAPPIAIPLAPVPIPAGAAAMISALERVAAEAGVSGSHRHGSIDERTRFLATFASDPAVRTDFARRTRGLRWALAAFAAVAVLSTALRLPVGIDRGASELRLAEGGSAEAEAEALLASGRGADATERFTAARALYAASAAIRARRPDDLYLRAVASLATYNAADLDRRRLGRADEARRGFDAALALAAGTEELTGDAVAFHARIDLGLLALRADPATTAPAAGVATATRLLAEASRLPMPSRDRTLREARLRLLESAIRLRSPDPDVAAKARRDLEVQAKHASSDPPWAHVADDARDELAATLPR